MHTMYKTALKLMMALLLVVTMFGAGSASSAYAACVPTVTFDLYAKTGTTTLYPGSPTVNIWGFSSGPTGATDPATLPGPVLDVVVGDCVGVNLTNVNIPNATSLIFQGQSLAPDTSGVVAGGSVTYTFLASNPGTFLYEAGLTPNGQIQVAMGMYGALIVRPATAGQAYNDASTAYDKEAVLVLSELDTTLNGSASPAGFDIRNFKPKYLLINGKAYPGTDTLFAAPGDNILFRYVNAGLTSHSMGVLGFSQRVIAEDGNPFQYAHTVVAESIAAGQTLDAIGTVPLSTPAGNKYAVYDTNLMLRNNTGLSSFAGFGGMITFIQVGTPVLPGPDSAGPATSNVSLPGTAVNGSMSAAMLASVSDVSTGNSNVTAAEYFIDTQGTSGTGAAMSGTFGTPGPINITATIAGATIGSLSSGNHTVYVHGQDSAGNWGPFTLGILKVDNAGPNTTTLSITPNPSGGSANVSLGATGNDTATGNSNISGAEYFIDVVGADGTGTAMSVNVASPIASLSASIPAATVNALSNGPHTVYVHSRDALNQWGATASIVLNVDKTGPTTTTAAASPSANNGTYAYNTSVQAVRVSGSFTDAASNMAGAELFIDTVGTSGTGAVFNPTDGSFNSASENGYTDIPLAIINSLTVGNHTIYVHGKDSAGNWGSMFSFTFLIDKTAPTFTGISLAPNPTYGATSVTMTVSGANDPLVSGLASGVTRGEYWFGTTNPTPGAGTPFSGLTPSINIGALTPGTYTVRARVRDAAGNWSANYQSATLNVVPNTVFDNGFESATAPWGWSSRSTTTTSRLNRTSGSAMVGSFGLQAQGNNTNYVQYNFGTTTNPATATFDGRFYFRPNGNTSTGKDIFAAASNTGYGASTLFRVRYRLNGTTPQVQIQVGTSNTNATWTNILGGTSNNVIEVVWQSGGTLQLYVNGVLAQTLTAGSGSVQTFRLGSVTTTGNATLMYFDAFSSKRLPTPLIGP